MRRILEIGSKAPKQMSVRQMCIQTLHKIAIQKRVKPKFLAIFNESIFIFEKKNDETSF